MKEWLSSLSIEQRRHLARSLDQRLLGWELVADALAQCGVRRISSVPGTPIEPILVAARKLGIRVLGFRHQMNAILAAAADNASSESLFHVALLSAGPATMNSLTGLQYAHDNHLPLLVLGSRRSLENEGCGYFQEIDVVPLVRHLTKDAQTVREAGAICTSISDAIQTAISGLQGPVYLDLPENVLEEKGPRSTCPMPGRPAPTLDAQKLDLVRKALAESRSPVLCLGEGLYPDIDTAALLQWVVKARIPFITTPMARGILPENHPLCANGMRRRIFQDCDALVMAGAWFDWRFRLGSSISPSAKVIHIHPVESQLGRNVDPHLAVNGSPAAYLNALSKCTTPLASTDGWIEQVSTGCALALAELSRRQQKQTSPMLPYELYQAIAHHAPADSLFAIDGSLTLTAAQFAIFPTRPRSWFDPGVSGLIGGSIGLAMGLKLAQPDRPVFALTGDTSFGMAGLELETCVRHRIPIVTIVGNNGGNGGHHKQSKYFSSDDEFICRYSDELPYHAIAANLGVPGYEIRLPSEIGPALEKVLASTTPACLNVHLHTKTTDQSFW